MAKVRANPVLDGLSGSMGNIAFRRLRDGRTIACAKPDFSQRKFSQGQKSHQERFRAAAAYARAAQSRPEYLKLAAGTLKTPYNVALSDWFHPPVVHSVEWREDKVRIVANDDVCVVQVRVKVLNADGTTIGQGLARQLNELEWEYIPSLPQAEGQRVVVEAEDLAGNRTREEK